MNPPAEDRLLKKKPNKKLGQHFLYNPQITERIANQLGPLQGRTLIEVGPGPGLLTESLLQTEAQQIIAVEYDRECIPLLEKRFRSQNPKIISGMLPDPLPAERLVIIHANALDMPLHQFGKGPRQIVSNLPYNIGTVLLMQWMLVIQEFEQLTLMFQKEVATRIVAAKGNGSYGRLSVMVQSHATVRSLFKLPPGAFSPPPQVDSQVIQLRPCPGPVGLSYFNLEYVVKTAFAQRRKMIRQALTPLFGSETVAILTQIGLPPTARAEELSLEMFHQLTRAFEKYKK